MPIDPHATTYYRQARFSTRLPNAYRYTPSHFWILEVESGLLRVGMTKFATRMLGDFVEFRFDVAQKEMIEVGQPIGVIEGFKAVSEIYSAVNGSFEGGNAELAEHPELMDSDPYDRGWLYQVRGSPGVDALDVTGYISVLDATIERMLAESQAREDRTC
jgi:glycine cleavage system H protein